MFEERADREMNRLELAGFIVELADSYEEEPECWENVTIDSFLRAWAAWLVDTNEHSPGDLIDEVSRADVITMQSVAKMLLAARVYE